MEFSRGVKLAQRNAAPTAEVPTWRVDPELERTARLYRRVDHADATAVRREAARRIQLTRMAGLWTATDPTVHFEDAFISEGEHSHDGAKGAEKPVRVRVYRPVAGRAPYPAVLYLHGGAFISGDLDFEHPRCLELCRGTGCVVVSVDYRLAPEHPFPAGLDDSLTAYRWLCGEGGRALTVDVTRVAVAGSSAGGALTAALCLAARERGLAPPRLQMLLYPVMDDRLETPSMHAFTDTPAWDSRNCVHMWNHYLGPAEHRGAVSPYAAPARATDLSGLPAAYVMVAAFDPLRDEGAEYAGRLVEAGVHVEFHQYPRAFHGFDTLASAAVSLRARREQCEVLLAAMR